MKYIAYTVIVAQNHTKLQNFPNLYNDNDLQAKYFQNRRTFIYNKSSKLSPSLRPLHSSYTIAHNQSHIHTDQFLLNKLSSVFVF